MASDGESFEPPSTPKSKMSGRAKSRQIVRWTDEKLAFAFAEFRNACAKHRLDIKKPLDEAAKAIGPFVTGDALIQQLAKRRQRYLDDLQKQSEETGTPVNIAGTPSARRGLDGSPAGGKKGTPKRRKTKIEKEVADLNDALSPNIAESIETPTSSVKRKARGSAKRTAVQKIKAEIQETPSTASDSDSDYDDSPSKPKKRARGSRAASAKKKQTYKEISADGAADWDEEEEYVDAVGGTNVVVEGAYSSEPSPTDAAFPTVSGQGMSGMKHPSTGGKYIEGYTPAKPGGRLMHDRHDSFDSAAGSSGQGQVEDVFVNDQGVQHIQPHQMFGNTPYGGSLHHPSVSNAHAQAQANAFMMAQMFGNGNGNNHHGMHMSMQHQDHNALPPQGQNALQHHSQLQMQPQGQIQMQPHGLTHNGSFQQQSSGTPSSPPPSQALTISPTHLRKDSSSSNAGSQDQVAAAASAAAAAASFQPAFNNDNSGAASFQPPLNNGNSFTGAHGLTSDDHFSQMMAMQGGFHGRLDDDFDALNFSFMNPEMYDNGTDGHYGSIGNGMGFINFDN